MEHKIKIGDTIKLDEKHEFIFTNYKVIATREGQELTVVCYDAMSVLRARDHSQMMQQTVKDFSKAGKLLVEKIEGDKGYE